MGVVVLGDMRFEVQLLALATVDGVDVVILVSVRVGGSAVGLSPRGSDQPYSAAHAVERHRQSAHFSDQVPPWLNF